MIETDPEVRAVAKAMSRTLRPWWERQGWRYNPFEHLDAARDPHLLEYLVVPRLARPLQGKEAALVLAPPGGGKTALRRYLERHALNTGGYIAPVLVVPSRHPGSPQEVEHLAVEALARRLFWQAVHYFKIESISWHTQAETRRFLGLLWQSYLRPVSDLSLLAHWLREENWSALESLLGPAYTPRPSTNTLISLAQILEDMSCTLPSGQSLPVERAWQEGLALLQAWKVGQVWLLLDGLDGFPESATLAGLWPAWAPMLEHWLAAQQDEPLPVVLKAFLPDTQNSKDIIVRHSNWPWRFLAWEEPELYEVLDKRVTAASRGLMDSLDALVAPELRPFAPRLLATLPAEEHLPRYLIERAGEVMRWLDSTDYLAPRLWQTIRQMWQ